MAADKKLPGLRHIGSQGRNPLVILGYNPTRNEVMVLDMTMLRQEEIIWLANFIADEKNYNRSALAPSLAEAVYSPGISGFINFAGRAQQQPLYEVRISDANQLKEWNGTDASHDPRIPPHPLVDRIREIRENGVASTPANRSGSGSEIPKEILEATNVRTSGGDVMDTVRQFVQSGNAANFVVNDELDGDKSSDETADRLAALEARFDRIEKLLSKQVAKPKKPATTFGKRTAKK